MNTRTKSFIAVVAAQALFLLSWAGWHEYSRDTGPTLLLQTRPVDPRDPLRGDYLILSYDISNPPGPSGRFGRKESLANIDLTTGRAVWVVLEPKGRYYTAVVLTPEKPTNLQANQVAVQGVINERRAVEYGIENYFVPEGKGYLPVHKTLVVEAALSPDHHLNLKRVLLDGKPYP